MLPRFSSNFEIVLILRFYEIIELKPGCTSHPQEWHGAWNIRPTSWFCIEKNGNSGEIPRKFLNLKSKHIHEPKILQASLLCINTWTLSEIPSKYLENKINRISRSSEGKQVSRFILHFCGTFLRFLLLSIRRIQLLRQFKNFSYITVFCNSTVSNTTTYAPPGKRERPPSRNGKNCCWKMMLFPKAQFLATTFPKIVRN